VQHFFFRLFRLGRLGVAAGAALWLLGGCAWHTHKVRSYDRSISDEDHDPTYHEDVERADVEVRDSQ
jgi:hypothetical protein